MQTNHQTKDVPPETTRRSLGAHGEGGARAILNMAGPEGLAFAISGACASYQTTSYQGSVEPFRKPDHKAKRHSRPHRWEERRAKRERQSREWPE